MCRTITCKQCGRPGWTGCGAHVEQVLAGVPPSERCSCASEAPGGHRRTWFRR